MVKTVWVKGDRKDYYEAETDFWKIVKGVMGKGEKFDLAPILQILRNRGSSKASKM
jgi:DNA-binding transcriptional regulator GbsR (MarR family)